MKSQEPQEKKFKELTEEELKDVTGGGCSKGEFTCPDGRKVSSFSQCAVLAALEAGVQEAYAALEVGVQGMTLVN